MGPIIEDNLGRALIIKQGSFWDVICTPIAGTLLAVSVVTAVLSYMRTVKTERGLSDPKFGAQKDTE
jgi:TctA family transporter